MDDAAVAEQRATQLKFIDGTLVPRILANDPDRFAGQRLVSAQSALQNQLDGYMSAIYNLTLTTEPENDGDGGAKKRSVHSIIVKLMKGDVNFRTGSKSYLQFANEVYIYASVLPAFRRLFEESGVGVAATMDIEQWVPHVYYGFFGAVAELSALDESILALQDLRPERFRGGPHLLLDESHLRLVVTLIAKYHSLSYALRIRHPDQYRQLVAGLLPLSFVPNARDGETVNLYTSVYNVALARFAVYMKRTAVRRSSQMRTDVANLYRLHGKRPVELLEQLRRDDGTFAAILHGDYNRNNVLFQYADAEGHAKPQAVRMIDFQEVRFASPALDLAFMLYMNSDLQATSAAIWDQLLQLYHDVMINSLATVTGLKTNDVALQPYSFDRFLDHFSQFAFYGVLVCMHFTPWKVCPDADCDRLATLFEREMHGDEFREFSMVIGGDEADERIAGIIQHASDRGYMRIFSPKKC